MMTVTPKVTHSRESLRALRLPNDYDQTAWQRVNKIREWRNKFRVQAEHFFQIYIVSNCSGDPKIYVTMENHPPLEFPLATSVERLKNAILLWL